MLHMNVRALSLTLAVCIAGAAVGARAQWVRTPANPIPRAKDGTARLTAPAPRTADGTPDLSGVWQAEGSPIPELIKLLPRGENGLGEDVPNKHFISIFADFAPGAEQLIP
jgi:hypothetical protein